MVEDSKESLNKAGDLIREGRTKSARAILLDILREDPEDAQAWFMLSYTIPDLERQISAVQRAVRLKPESEKARQRLVDLGGELPDENDLFDVPDPTSPITAELTPILPPAPGKVELPDTTEAVEVDTPTEELDPLDAFRDRGEELDPDRFAFEFESLEHTVVTCLGTHQYSFVERRPTRERPSPISSCWGL